MPQLSIVIPTYNSAYTLNQTLTALTTQKLINQAEMFVVDDGSTDNTKSVVQAHIKRSPDISIKYVYQNNKGPAGARNTGLKKSRGEFVVFIDHDCTPEPLWMSNLLDGFDNEQVAGVGGKTKGQDNNLIGSYIDLAGFLNPRIKNDQVDYIITCNACFKRRVLLDIGGFNEKFVTLGGEDVEICVRIKKQGHEFRFQENAVVLHNHRRTLFTHLKTIFNYGKGRYFIGKLWPERKIKNPGKLLLKTFINPLIPYRFAARTNTASFLYKMICGWLHYLTEQAFVWGYIRGKYVYG